MSNPNNLLFLCRGACLAKWSSVEQLKENKESLSVKKEAYQAIHPMVSLLVY